LDEFASFTLQFNVTTYKLKITIQFTYSSFVNLQLTLFFKRILFIDDF
ncbi:MAG: hypothetical protein ACI9SI_002090, partial [Polaribacter sp.]